MRKTREITKQMQFYYLEKQTVDGFSRAEIARLSALREARKAKKIKLDPYRYDH